MVECAHAAVRVRDSKFRTLFLCVRVKKRNKTVYDTVAHKMLTVVLHLLLNSERYVEEGFYKASAIRRGRVECGGWIGQII